MDGIIVINKEKGCTSHDVVYKVKKLFNTKVGHTGTLDPNATGVLPILVGKGTLLSKYLINHNKKYIATIKLGQRTDTADVEGNIIEEKEVDVAKLNSENILGIFNTMIGKQMQKPPMYSAIKVNGKKLYEYARSGKSVVVPEREIELYDLKLLNIDVENMLLQFEVHCSKGTYIRTVCEQIASKLGTVGYMLDLKRTMVGDFKIENSITISELSENINNTDFLKKYFISIEDLFENKESVELSEKELTKFLNGLVFDMDCCDGVVKVYNLKNEFIGIGTIEKGYLKRDIVVK